MVSSLRKGRRWKSLVLIVKVVLLSWEVTETDAVLNRGSRAEEIVELKRDSICGALDEVSGECDFRVMLSNAALVA